MKTYEILSLVILCTICTGSTIAYALNIPVIYYAGIALLTLWTIKITGGNHSPGSPKSQNPINK